jgi:hypothetical protein
MPVDRDPTLNEPRRKLPPNLAPGGDIGDARELGRAGQRMILDRVLQSVDAFGKAQIEFAGVRLRDIARHRDDMAALLGQVIRHDGRRASRQRERAAAIRIAGHFQLVEAEPLLMEILASRAEDPRQRAAAADALGLMRSERAIALLMTHLRDSHGIVRESAAGALGVIAPLDSVDELKTLMSRLDDPGPLAAAIRKIETRHGREPSAVEPERARKGRGHGKTRRVEIPWFAKTEGPDGEGERIESDRPKQAKDRRAGGHGSQKG